MKQRVATVLLVLVVAAAVATAFLEPAQPSGGEPGPSGPAPLLAATAAPAEILIRPHSPVLGAAEAPVTVVEVFDPSCEACRAYYPHVKKILATHPGKVKLVLRYALFHKGSDVAAALLEMARMQGKYESALEALLDRQPEWAAHGAPDLALAARIVQGVGVDVSARKQQEAVGAVQRILQQDTADVNALQIERTPTFFVNGRQLITPSHQALGEAVAIEVAKHAR
jgi:protein-disulfide isomerase